MVTGSEIRHRDDSIPFCHAAIAVEGCGWANPDNLPLMIASTIIGAWDRTQGIGALNASAVARAGAEGKAISYQAFNTCYKDTGLWGVYFVSERHIVEVSDFYSEQNLIISLDKIKTIFSSTRISVAPLLTNSDVCAPL